MVQRIGEGAKKFLFMHDLLQEMGRDIVSHEYPYNASRCSRLWSHEEINGLLNGNKASFLEFKLILLKLLILFLLFNLFRFLPSLSYSSSMLGFKKSSKYFFEFTTGV